MQKTIFRNAEGDCYFERNLEANRQSHAKAIADPNSDPIVKTLVALRPASILEVGTGIGWRLDAVHRHTGAKCIGLDPSPRAIAEGRKFNGIELSVGTADDLGSHSVDAVVFAFCLYLCDREDLFQIAREADRVLNKSGHLLVYDFYTRSAYANPYKHRDGVLSYKMDYSQLWSWHPHYVLWSHQVLPFHDENPDDEDNRLALSVLKKVG